MSGPPTLSHPLNGFFPTVLCTYYSSSKGLTSSGLSSQTHLLNQIFTIPCAGANACRHRIGRYSTSFLLAAVGLHPLSFEMRPFCLSHYETGSDCESLLKNAICPYKPINAPSSVKRSNPLAVHSPLAEERGGGKKMTEYKQGPERRSLIWGIWGISLCILAECQWLKLRKKTNQIFEFFLF